MDMPLSPSKEGSVNLEIVVGDSDAEADTDMDLDFAVEPSAGPLAAGRVGPLLDTGGGRAARGCRGRRSSRRLHCLERGLECYTAPAREPCRRRLSTNRGQTLSPQRDQFAVYAADGVCEEAAPQVHRLGCESSGWGCDADAIGTGRWVSAEFCRDLRSALREGGGGGTLTRLRLGRGKI